MSTPPKASTTLSNAAFTDAASVTSQATADALPIAFALSPPQRLHSTSSSATSAPAAANAFAVAAPMAPPAPVIDRDLAGQRLLGFALPSLACSSDQYSRSNMSSSADRLEAADRFGVGDGLDRGFGEVGGDARVLLRRPSPNRPTPGTSTTRGTGSSSFLMPPTRALLRVEIVLVVRDEASRPRRARPA